MWAILSLIFAEKKSCIQILAGYSHECKNGFDYVQKYSKISMNTDGSFTLDDSNSFWVPTKFLRKLKKTNTVYSRYLEFQGPLWNTSRYRYFDISDLQEKLIRLTTFIKYLFNWTKKYIENIVEKRRNCSLGAISPLFHNIFYMLLDFHV